MRALERSLNIRHYLRRLRDQQSLPLARDVNPGDPIDMVLASAGLLGYLKEAEAKQASRAIYEATLETVYDGIKTADIGGSAHTDEFTNEVIRRVRTKVEIWATLT